MFPMCPILRIVSSNHEKTPPKSGHTACRFWIRRILVKKASYSKWPQIPGRYKLQVPGTSLDAAINVKSGRYVWASIK